MVAADPGLLLMVPALGMLLLVVGHRRRRCGYTLRRRVLGWLVGSVLLAVAVMGILAWFTAAPVLATDDLPAAGSALDAGSAPAADDAEVTKYYYAGRQRVAMRGSERRRSTYGLFFSGAKGIS